MYFSVFAVIEECCDSCLLSPFIKRALSVRLSAVPSAWGHALSLLHSLPPRCGRPLPASWLPRRPALATPGSF